ncbi:MAG: adenylate/guanylate cyclase domain-containing protein [SAR324 cluster bacterium]|nr:adenylate/guanylate cyclase domain-containing protein [SAR324 cluster bacterium]
MGASFKQSRILISLFISIISLILCFLIEQGEFLTFLENKLFDYRLRAVHAQDSISQDIVIILIDEASLKTMAPLAGRWPWPRSLFAELIEFLTNAEAKMVLFDIMFTEPQTPRLPNGELGPDDMALAYSTAGSGIVIHASQFVQEDHNSQKIIPQTIPEDFVNAFSLHDISTRDISLPDTNTFYLPLTELYQGALGVGIVEFRPDSDGVYRRTQLVRKHGTDYFPVLSLATLLQLQNMPPLQISSGLLHFGSIKFPLEKDGSYLINMRRKFMDYSISGLFATIQQIRNGQTENLLIDPEEFRDKIIIIGASAAGVEDLKHTSLGENLPGVFLHASILSNGLNHEFIRTLPGMVGWIAAFIGGLWLAWGIQWSKNIWAQLVIILPLFTGWIAIALFSFAKTLVWIPVIPVILPWALTISGALSWKATTEGREKRKTRKMFSQYVSPAILAEVMNSNKETLTPQVGIKENLTVLFSDIRGFTSFSETTPTEQVVEMLNYYLKEMVNVVFEYDGTLDKFIGDAIMAFWGAPLKTENHPEKAVIAALRMKDALIRVNDHFHEKGFPGFEIGIGLNTGSMILGNIGSEKKLDYTVIGDNVNLASRIEGMTKHYGCDILVSDSTRNRVSDEICFRIVDYVQAKGKQQSIKIYHPLGFEAELSADQMSLARETNRGFTAYQNRDWETAIQAYQNNLSIIPKDRLSQMFIQRCREYQETPPPDSWNGSHVLTGK